MKTQLRHLIADAMYVAKSYNLPSVCERYGLESGSDQEAFASKNRYVMKRLESLSDEQVLNLARQVVQDYPADKVLAAIEQIDSEKCLISDITRNYVAAALNDFSLGGERDLDELLRKYWPKTGIS